MGILIDTLANLEYGLLIAIVIDVTLLFGIASANSKSKFSVLSYIIALVLLVPLTFQMSRLIGACQVSDATTAINDIVGTVSPTLEKYIASATDQDMGWFIFRRVLWSVLFVAAGGSAIFFTMTKKKRRLYDDFGEGYSGDSYISGGYSSSKYEYD